jgi:hypothetical protein
MISKMVDRFSLLMNLIASHSEKFLKKYIKDKYEQETADITWQWKCKIYERQRTCSHLKGSELRGPFVKDYAITTHTFIDGRTRCKCMLCGLEAWSRSGEDFKFAYLRDLAYVSTNTASSSEQPMYVVTEGKETSDHFPATPKGLATLKAKYPNVQVPPDIEQQHEISIGGPYSYNEYDIKEGKSPYLNIGEDTSPIKGVQPATKMDLGEPPSGIQDKATGEVFVRAEDGTAVSWGVYPIEKEDKK